MIGKLIALIKYFQAKEFIRFLETGFVNTLIGWGVTLLFVTAGIEYRLSQTLSFILCFPIAYTTQTLFAFKTKWSWGRLIVYPLSSLPNYLIQIAVSTLCVEVLAIPKEYAVTVAQVAPLPIMFFIIRFLVKGEGRFMEIVRNIRNKWRVS